MIRSPLSGPKTPTGSSGLAPADVSVFPDYPVGPNKLRTCLCLALSLKLQTISRSSIPSAEALEMVQEWGDLALIWAKALIFYQSRHSMRLTNILSRRFDCFYHDHRTAPPCSLPPTVPTASESRMMIEIRDHLRYVGASRDDTQRSDRARYSKDPWQIRSPRTPVVNGLLLIGVF